MRPYILIGSCLLFSLSVQAQTGDIIGTVITTKGRVEARDAAGATRTLTRRMQLSVGDTIVVGVDGFANVRMIDNGQISFGLGTEFVFDQYRFDSNPATPDSALMSFVSGCFRTVAGSIGSADSDTYRIDTPFASIGTTGTFHGGVIVGDILYTGTWDGGTTVSNSVGSINLGLGSDYDYSRTVPGSVPEGQVTEPVEMGCQAGLANNAPDTDDVVQPILSPAPSALESFRRDP